MFTKTQFTIQIYAQVFLKHQLLNGVYYYEYNKNWRLWTILSNKNVSVNVFWYVKVYVSWKFIQYTTHWDKTQKSSQKMHSFFFRELITVFSFSFSFFFFTYTSWSTRFISLELCVRFSIPSFLSVLSKLIFLFNKKHGLFAFKTHNSFQNKNYRKAAQSCFQTSDF